MKPNDLIAFADAEEPAPGLEAIAALRKWINKREADLVVKAQVEGMPWNQIAGLLGRSKQAVWEKHSPHLDELDDEGLLDLYERKVATDRPFAAAAGPDGSLPRWDIRSLQAIRNELRRRELQQDILDRDLPPV